MLYLFDKNENLIHELASNELESLIQHEELNKLMTLEFSVFIDSNYKMEGIEYVAHKDMEDYQKIQMYRVVSSESDDYTVNYQAVHIIFDELKSYGYIRDKRPNKVKASAALDIALAGSRWKIGVVDDSDLLSANFYDSTRLDALSKIIKLWNLDLYFYLTFNGNKITGRYIDLLSFRGEDTGERFVYGSNALEVVKEVDVSDVYTRVIPRGKGEEKFDKDGKPTEGYGRRIKIDDVLWERSKGDPIDKPKGQEYLELKEMTEKFGFSDGEPRTKVQVFEDIEDQNELIKAGYDFLVKVSRPLVQFKTKVSKRSRTNVGDVVRIIRKDLDFYYRTRIYKVHRNLLNKALEVEFGDKLIQSPADREKIVNDNLHSLENRLKETETDLKSSFVDRINEGIIHASFNRDGYNYELKKGNKYGLPAGYYSFDREIDDNPQRVIYVGAGTLAIADSKKSNGDWNFRTFGTGRGFVADLLVAGTILGGKVRWNLEDGTFLIGDSVTNYSMYWDGSTLHLRNVNINLENNKTIQDLLENQNLSKKEIEDRKREIQEASDIIDKASKEIEDTKTQLSETNIKLKDKVSKNDILYDSKIQAILKGKDGKDGLPGKQGTPGRDGKDGMPGKAGADGRTSYMHFAYADSQDGAVGFTLTATNGKKYIGFYTDFVKEDSKDPAKYEWSKYVGDDGKPGKDGSQGIPGKAGADGKTPYFHTAWANNSTGTSGFSTSQAGDKAYIGTYTDYIKSDSTDPSKYTWQLVKGNKGDKGEAGKQGIPGRDGESSIYTWNMLRNSRNFTKLTAYKDCTYKILDNKYKISNTNINDGIHVTTSGGDSLLKVYLGFSNDDVDELIAGEKYTFSLYVLNLSNQSFFLGINGFLFERYEIISGYSGRISISGVYLKDLVPQIQFQASNKDDRLDLVYAELKVEPGEIKNTSWTPHKTEINGKDGKDGKTGKIGQNLLRKSNVPIVDNVNYVGGSWKLCESLKDDELLTFTCKIKTQKKDGFNLFNSGGSIILSGKYIYPSDDYIIESFTFPWKTFADVSWGAKHYEQANPPYINLYVWSNGNGTDKNNNKVSIEWATLTRGDIPAIEWSPCYKDLEDIVSVSQEEIERELIKVKADFKIENDKIKANVESLSVGTIKEFGKLRDDFDKSINDAKNKVYLGTKEFVEKNFTSKEQTDRKIASIAEQIKVTVGERFDSLQKTIIQNKTSIKQLSDSINLTVSSVRKDIDTNKNDIRQRVKKSELISEINLTPGTALIRADKIRFEGANVDVQGTFSTLNGSNQVGVYINYNQIQFRDNRWNGKTFGMISVAKYINHSGMDLTLGHYATGSLGISYYENNLWHNYITFDRWGLSPDKVYNDSNIIFNENASMQYNALRFGKMEILASSSNVLKIKHIDKKLGYLFYFGDNETNFYYYYAADNKDHLQPVSWDSPKGETL